MNSISNMVILGLPIFIMVSAFAAAMKLDLAASFILSAAITGLLLMRAFGNWSDDGKQTGYLRKRAYSMDLQTLAKRFQIAMAGAWMGKSVWMLEPSTDLSSGYLCYSIRWDETWSCDSAAGHTRKRGWMEVYLTDASSYSGGPRTDAIISFSDNSVLDAAQFEKAIRVVMARVDFMIPGHQKIVLSAEEKRAYVFDYRNADPWR